MTESQSGEDTDETIADGTGNGRSSDNASLAYRAVMVAVVGLGGIAVVAGLAGTFLTLTGGTDGGTEYDILGEYECTAFEGDPSVGHDADYEIERGVLSPSEVSEFEGSLVDGGVEIRLETAGVLLDASASESDGQAVDIETDDDTVRIERDTTGPFRLWVDTVAADGTVTRMQLDICPPRE